MLYKKYPKIDSIRGEETNQFKNSQGITIEIELNGNRNDLEEQLNQVLIDHANAAKLLVDLIYEEDSTANELKVNQQLFEVDLNDEDLGIWIDPIGKWFFDA